MRYTYTISILFNSWHASQVNLQITFNDFELYCGGCTCSNYAKLNFSYISCFTISNVIAPQFICIDEAWLGYINIIHIRFPSSLHIVFCGVFLMQHKVGRKRYIKLGPGVLHDFPTYHYLLEERIFNWAITCFWKLIEYSYRLQMNSTI